MADRLDDCIRGGTGHSRRGRGWAGGFYATAKGPNRGDRDECGVHPQRRWVGAAGGAMVP